MYLAHHELASIVIIVIINIIYHRHNDVIWKAVGAACNADLSFLNLLFPGTLLGSSFIQLLLPLGLTSLLQLFLTLHALNLSLHLLLLNLQYMQCTGSCKELTVTMYVHGLDTILSLRMCMA